VVRESGRRNSRRISMADSLSALQTAFTEFAPRLIGAILVLILVLLVARLLQRLTVRLLQRIGFDGVFERTGTASSLRRIGLSGSLAVILGYVVFWGVVLAGASAALSVLGLASLQENASQLVVLAGRALIAALILAAGLAAAGWLSRLVAQRAEEADLAGSDVFRQAVFIAVLVIAALLAAGQLGINVSLLVLITALVLGTMGLMAALALGFGLAPLSGNIAAGRYVRGNDIRPGDEISVRGIEGTVEELGYASVTLRSKDGRMHHVPNRLLLEGVVSKMPRREESR